MAFLSPFRSLHTAAIAALGTCTLDDALCELVLFRCGLDTVVHTPVMAHLVQFVRRNRAVAGSLSPRITSSVEYVVAALSARRLYTHAVDAVFRVEVFPPDLQSFGTGRVLLGRQLRHAVDCWAGRDDGMFAIAKAALRMYESDCVAIPPVDLTPVFADLFLSL